MKQELAQDIALMRYSMISPLIVGLPDEYRSKEAYFRAASARGALHPNGSFIHPAPTSIKRWYQHYQKNGFDALSQIIEANVTTAGIIAEKTKNLEELKQTIINSITELSAISEENAASNEEVTANVSDIAEAVNKISDDTGTIKKVSTDLEELMQYFK